MSRLARVLPWGLLALSLAAHAWQQFAPRPSAAAVPAGTRAPADHSAPSAPSYPTAPRSTPPELAEAAAAAAPPPPSPPAPAVTFAAYADLLAGSLETPGQHEDLARVLARWVAVDPVGASEWLDRHPDDPRFDLPVAQVATHLVAEGDYELAREWADSIRTPEVRLMAIEEVLAEQYRHHRLTPATLATAAARAGLPADRVRGILDYSRLD